MLRHRGRVTTSDATDAAMLEADVMRFMAILAFCLMVVFALIQAIPPSRTTQDLNIRPESLLRQRQQLSDQVAELEGSLAHHEQALGKARRQLEQLHAEVERRQADVDRLEGHIAELEEQGTPAGTPVTQHHENEAAPDKPPAPVPAAAPQRTLTLRFDSTAAIRTLLRSGQVDLYAELGSGLWRARRSLTFERASANSVTYQLTGSPGREVEQALRRSAGVISVQSPRWLVQFEPRLLGEIRNAMAAADQNSDLVIQEDGRVRVEPVTEP